MAKWREIPAVKTGSDYFTSPVVTSAEDRKKVASDGLSTSYYSLPAHATELRHLISQKGMSKSRGDIFKACYRLGEKDGTDTLYDLNKMKFFIEDLIEMHKRGEHL
jgi:hypothetical protein